MSSKTRSFLTVVSFVAFFVFLILFCVLKSTLFVALLVWSMCFIATLTFLDVDFDGVGGVGGYVPVDPDPTGKKTVRGLVVSTVIGLISLAYMQYAHLFFTIQKSAEYDTKQFVPVLILLIIFGAFGFRR